MRVFQIVSGIKKESGGPSYSVPALCSQIHNLGIPIELNVLGNASDLTYNFQIITHKNVFSKKLGISSDMKRSLLSRVGKGDILHSHGLWMMPNIYPGNIAKRVNAKLVLSPRGMLSEWSLNQSKKAKRIVGLLGQNNVILNADCIHATAESEYDDVRSFGYKGPVVIIPNGVDVFSKFDVMDKSKKKIVFISRVHPIKGIELLLNAWSNISSLHQDWELIICGPGDLAYVEKIKKLIREMPNSRVSYLSPVYGKDKNEFYNNASLFVLPTHTENFGIVVAEALSYGVPAIVSKGAPWSGLVENNCGWWINNTVSELEETLNYALTLPEKKLSMMGRNGRDWMKKDFSWVEIGKKMLATYHWLNGVGKKPNCVVLD